MTVIFVGDKPSPRMTPGAAPFQGAASEKRLKAWIKYLGVKDYRIINQSDISSMNVYANMARFMGVCTFVALGNNASKALKNWHFSLNHFKLPHPSGLNRQLNDPTFIAQRLIDCKAYLKERHHD